MNGLNMDTSNTWTYDMSWVYLKELRFMEKLDEVEAETLYLFIKEGYFHCNGESLEIDREGGLSHLLNSLPENIYQTYSSMMRYVNTQKRRLIGADAWVGNILSSSIEELSSSYDYLKFREEYMFNSLKDFKEEITNKDGSKTTLSILTLYNYGLHGLVLDPKGKEDKKILGDFLGFLQENVNTELLSEYEPEEF